MTAASELANHLHGVPVGKSSFEVYCDCHHETPQAVDFEESVQYEYFRVGETMELFDGLPIVGIWAPDLLRCDSCTIEALQDPTAGYGEALVEVDIAWRNDQRVIDAGDIAVLDHSPVDEGEDPPTVPTSVIETVFQQREWGLLQRSRIAAHAGQLREQGMDELADSLEQDL